MEMFNRRKTRPDLSKAVLHTNDIGDVPGVLEQRKSIRPATVFPQHQLVIRGHRALKQVFGQACNQQKENSTRREDALKKDEKLTRRSKSLVMFDILYSINFVDDL